MVREGARGEPVSPAQDSEDRRRWLAQVDAVRVVGTCGCGMCPTIDLAVPGVPDATAAPLVVLEAGVDRALVLLFVDADLLSCLELAPLDDTRFVELPPANELRF
ncbi:hypothetical protein [Cellulosimicrobium sp. SH8]|uniref:hypothetical protein n=1 Tax=Cellulosimicrobium sp. SH8 TaxID=2952936 RepID=UPI0021F31142|nr:hypothetical protein [Cellulosimicrobium sp. SH8]